MESIVLRYDKGESIGSINSVDTGMATAIICLLYTSPSPRDCS